ncbi:MAG: tetratricopeptide repeat protein [Bacteroidetes bacterium]|nr:tetratricopeptide repeat protein [Bacteroidota bacterium]
MAKKEEELLNIGETYNRAEKWLNKYKNSIMIIGFVLIVGVGGWIWYTRSYLPQIEVTAQEQIYNAEKYFGIDSFRLAIDGDGNSPGFLEIIADYGSSKAANLSRYYAGISYLRLQEYQNAIDQLKKFKSRDHYLSSMAMAATGDAYMELGNPDKAVSSYERAAGHHVNDLITPMFLFKAGLANERNNNPAKARTYYEKIKFDYPNSMEAAEIDKYIARAH